ncbi:MAG: toll/interleukin-1 receptor domain-containing protein [Xanthobacteraceae bacterium]
MKVFVSWSGEKSHAVAKLLENWLPDVIQQVKPWISSQDILKGERWATTLWQSLSETDFGLIVVTSDNLQAPWLWFEAGALSKALEAKVIPLLCDITLADIAKTPLSQFQTARVSKEELFSVVESINNECSEPLSNSRLRTAFDRICDSFIEQFKNIDFSDSKKRDPDVHSRLSNIEALLEDILGRLNRSSSPPLTRQDIISTELKANDEKYLELLKDIFGDKRMPKDVVFASRSNTGDSIKQMARRILQADQKDKKEDGNEEDKNTNTKDKKET